MLGVTEFWDEIDLFPPSSGTPGKSPLPVPALPVISPISVAWHDDGCGVPSTDDMRAVLVAPPALACFVMATLGCNCLWQGL